MCSIATVRELVEDDLRKAMELSAGTCTAPIAPATFYAGFRLV